MRFSPLPGAISYVRSDIIGSCIQASASVLLSPFVSCESPTGSKASKRSKEDKKAAGEEDAVVASPSTKRPESKIPRRA